MMHRANVPMEARYKIFPKAFETATDLDNLVIKEINGVTQTRIEHFCGDLPRYANKLRTWGEAGTVTVKKKGMPKIADRGITCMFVGYAKQHGTDVYDMWDPMNNILYVTRDIIWF